MCAWKQFVVINRFVSRAAAASLQTLITPHTVHLGVLYAANAQVQVDAKAAAGAPLLRLDHVPLPTESASGWSWSSDVASQQQPTWLPFVCTLQADGELLAFSSLGVDPVWRLNLKNCDIDAAASTWTVSLTHTQLQQTTHLRFSTTEEKETYVQLMQDVCAGKYLPSLEEEKEPILPASPPLLTTSSSISSTSSGSSSATHSTTFTCVRCLQQLPLHHVFVPSVALAPAPPLPASEPAAATALGGTDPAAPIIPSPWSCTSCVVACLQQRMQEAPAVQVLAEFTLQDIQDLLSPEAANRYLEKASEDVLAGGKNTFACPKCKSRYDISHHSWSTKASYLNTEKGIDNRPLSESAQTHYLANRFRCRNDRCDTTFCKSCQVMPYHAGFDCAGYVGYLAAPKCRYCEAALMDHNTPASGPHERFEF